MGTVARLQQASVTTLVGTVVTQDGAALDLSSATVVLYAIRPGDRKRLTLSATGTSTGFTYKCSVSDFPYPGRVVFQAKITIGADVTWTDLVEDQIHENIA